MTEFSMRPHQHVDPQLRGRDTSSTHIRVIPRNEKAGCNLEWYLTQQQNTRQPSRSGGSRQQFRSQKDCEHQTRNLLMSSQTTKRSLLQSRQRTAGQMFRSNDNLKSNPSAFSFLTTQTQFPRQSTRASSMKRLKPKKKDDQVELSQSQVVRKIHSDLQEYAIQQLEEREHEKIGTKMKFAISQLKQSAHLQNLAIKFWILIVNLQYYDVKKLTQNFNERKVSRLGDRGDGIDNDVKVQHTQLPVDLKIYERVITLFMKALGSVGDPHFNPVAIPSSIERFNAIIKRSQKGMLLNGSVHFDKFIVDLGLMLGRNLLNLTNSDVAYIYRRCMLAMTQRFNDDFHLIQAGNIKSPFEMSSILQAQRNILGVNRSPVNVIIESSIHSNRDDNNGNNKRSRQASRVQIIQSNEEKNSNKSNASARHSNQVGGYGRQKTNPTPLSAKNMPGLPSTDYLVRGPTRKNTEKHRNSFANFTKTQQVDNAELLPLPPHLDHEVLPEPPTQLIQRRSQQSLQLIRTSSQLGKKRSEIQIDVDSKSSQRSKRQQIEVGIPMEKALIDEDQDLFGTNKKKSRDTDMKISSSEESQDDANVVIEAQITHKPLHKIPMVTDHGGLFNLDRLTQKRQDFKDELAAKIAYTQAKTASMVPFEAVHSKRSCLEVLEQAREYLIDESTRVSKTPAGFNRPRGGESKKRIYMKNKDMVAVDHDDEIAQNNLAFLARQTTKRLDFDSTKSKGDNGQPQNRIVIELRDSANATQELNLALPFHSDLQSDQAALSKLPQPMPLAKRHTNKHLHTNESSQNEEASILSGKEPIVHVTKCGMRIPASMSMDPGYIMHRLEETAKEVIKANDPNSEEELISSRQDRFETQARESLLMQSFPLAFVHAALAKQAKLEMKTNRLLQESTLDNIFRNHNISKLLKQPQQAKEKDERQFIDVISKLNHDSLARQPPRQRQDVLKDISFQEIQQKSFEEGDQTHATTSNDDSQFMTQDPVTHPKFTQEQPVDYPDMMQVYGMPDGNHLDSTQKSQLTPKGKKQGFNGKVTTLQKPVLLAKQESAGGGKQNSSLAVRRRVFGFQHVKNLTMISPSQTPTKVHERSPIIVNSVEKTDIEEMEGKTTVLPFKVNQKVGSDGNTNRSQLHALNVDGMRQQQQLIVSNNNTLGLGNGSGFDRDRKSQVTAHLASGNESWKAFSSPENQLSESATQSFFKRQNSDYVEKLSQREVANKDYRSGNKSAKNPHFVRSGPMSDLACSDLDQVMSFQDRYSSTKNMVQGKKNSHSSFSKPSKGAITSGDRLVNINVNVTGGEERRASSQQISLISVNQVRKVRKSSKGQMSSQLSYADKVRVMKKKQDQIFPFGEPVHDQAAATRKASKAIEKGGQDQETNKIKDGLFALRRANKNRRQQIQKATNEKKERICNSLIPGVDYSRQVRQFKASYGQIYDSQGNQLTAIPDPLKSQVLQKGGTLLIPEELMQKMQFEGFMVFQQDSTEQQTKINNGIKSNNFQGSFTLKEGSLMGSVMPSKQSSVDGREYSNLISNMAPSTMREIVVKNNKIQLPSEKTVPYQMMIRTETQNKTQLSKRTNEEGASTQILLGENGSPLQHKLTEFSGNIEQQVQAAAFDKLNLEQVADDGKVEMVATAERLSGKTKSLALIQQTSEAQTAKLVTEQTERGDHEYHTIHQMGPPGDAKNQPIFNQK